MNNAAPLPCAANPDWWFSTSAVKVAAAKRLCADCYFQAQCEQIAIEEGSEYGIWAGRDITEILTTSTTQDLLQPAGAA